eukprot:6454569-Heterocapsa_arctica.AAC.1
MGLVGDRAFLLAARTAGRSVLHARGSLPVSRRPLSFEAERAVKLCARFWSVGCLFQGGACIIHHGCPLLPA